MAQCESCQRANDLALAGRLWSRVPKEPDLELQVRRAAILGTEFILANDFVPSQKCYEPGLIIERRLLSRLVEELAGLDHFLGTHRPRPGSQQGQLF